MTQGSAEKDKAPGTVLFSLRNLLPIVPAAAQHRKADGFVQVRSQAKTDPRMSISKALRL